MEEIVAILAIFVFLPTIIAVAIAITKWAKYRAMGAGEGDGLRKSELQALIRQAVEEAVAPLHDRLDALTEADEPPRLDPATLADVFEDPDDDLPAARRRTRS